MGGNYRYNNISVQDTDFISSIESVDSYYQYGGFLQAQFGLIPDTLKLIIGNKIEYNSFTGWENQPMVRLTWKPESEHVFWSSISQGVRIPSLIEYNGNALANGANVIDGYPLFRAEILGRSDVQAETSLSKEFGYRYNVQSWGFDASLFHTQSENVLAFKTDLDFASNIVYHNFVSNTELTTYGGEAVLKWQPNEQLTTELGYSFTSYKYDLPENTNAAIGYDAYLRQFISKVNYVISDGHSLFAVYRVESGDAYDTDGFSVLDLNWNWQVSPSATVSLSGMNLLYGRHLEYNNTSETYTVATYIEPSYLIRLTMKL
ncbi:TonB-dependent receptor plug domain-containing protein [Psychromonas sp. KJ10-10]|uniref:TonB-dependent receptor plug domain-containing protein n=1 Tax=Psychromonas sp. KJ10-10 TaxID=3391823 RepID=UPI0039B6108F